MTDVPDQVWATVAKRALEWRLATAALDVLCGFEERLIEASLSLEDAAGIDTEERDVVMPAELRREQLREATKAKLEGEFREWWVKNIANVERAEEAAEKVGVDWSIQKEWWAYTERQAGEEGSDDELAAQHVAERYDCSLDEFRELVVEWPEDGLQGRSREAFEWQQLVAGRAEEALASIEAVAENLDDDNDE
jgi:hypothetical protein